MAPKALRWHGDVPNRALFPAANSGRRRHKQMGITDSSHREIIEYLRFLVGHEAECALDACPVCSTLANICELAESLLFSIRFYQSANPPEDNQASTTAAG